MLINKSVDGRSDLLMPYKFYHTKGKNRLSRETIVSLTADVFFQASFPALIFRLPLIVVQICIFFKLSFKF